MILYLLKSTLCLLLLLAIYQLFLEREKMHQFNRYYLLGSILFAFLVPLYTIYTKATALVFETYPIQNLALETIEISAKNTATSSFDYQFYALLFYVLVAVVLLFRFGRNLHKIIQKIRKNTHVSYQKATLVLVDDAILPHTFLHYIFINKKEYENGAIETELFTHELTHVTQKHTIDVLILELLQVFFWFNPLFIFIKKAIKLNHEFLADTKVIASHKNISEYQTLLINKAAWNNTYYLASNLNYSLTKKRLLMMTTQKSRRKILLKKLALVPLLAGFVFLFANRVEAQETLTITKDKKTVPTFQDKTEEELYMEYVNKNVHITFTDKNGKKNIKHFNEMTDKEKESIKPLYISKIQKKNVPTKTQLNNWKNTSKYAIWIDGKVVKNTVLNHYKNTDFSNFFDSFVHKNARTKRFPQTHQVYLNTNAYFKKKNEENVKAFEAYKKFHKIKNKHTIYPLKKALKNSIKNVSEQQKSATKKQVATYNRLAKKYNKIVKKKRIIKLGDLQKMESIYKIMTPQQKEKAQPFPNSVPPPPAPEKIAFTKIPPPPKPVLIKGATKKEIIKFNIEHKKWKKEIEKYPPPPPPQKKLLKKTTSKIPEQNPFVYSADTVIISKAQKGDNSSKEYFLDNKRITWEELKKLSPHTLAKIRIKNNTDGSKSMYLTSRKK